jgi:hypothetical protein
MMSSSEPEHALLEEVTAALVLGRLEGTLTHTAPATIRIFATRLIRDILITALRQDGHSFTDLRFDAWYAGLATLSDERPRSTLAPRPLCEGILTELSHASWEPLAVASRNWQLACLAPQDPQAEGAHLDTHQLIAAARTLLDETNAPLFSLPFPALAALHDAVAQSSFFAPIQRDLGTIEVNGARRTLLRTENASPIWAIEILAGQFLHRCGCVQLALPWPGLVALNSVTPLERVEEHRALRAAAFRKVAQNHLDGLDRAANLSAHMHGKPPGSRSSSRAPALLELLAGFGALRCRQIQNLLSASRLGARGMLSSLEAAGMLESTKLQGVWLYSARSGDRPCSSSPIAGVAPSLSPAALNDFEASMADIDRLLSRYEDQPIPEED